MICVSRDGRSSTEPGTLIFCAAVFAHPSSGKPMSITTASSSLEETFDYLSSVPKSCGDF